MDGYTWSDDEASADIDRILDKLGGVPKKSTEAAPADLVHLDHEVRTANFWESLTPDQLYYVRTMMLSIQGPNGEPDAKAHYYVGYADSLLRSKFGACPRCMSSHQTDECFDEVMSSNREYRAACKQYNVTPEDGNACNFSAGAVTCRDCGAVFRSLAERMVTAGVSACPGCASRNAAVKRT